MAAHGLEIVVLDLLRRPGARRQFTASVDLTGGGLTSAQIADAPVVVDLSLEAQSNQVVVTGDVAFSWQGECRRCLEPTTQAERVGIREVFEPVPVDGETWPLATDRIDLEPVVREAVLLALPLAPLCGPDCIGPDPDHYPATSAADDRPARGGGEPPLAPTRDPRWAALDDLHFD